VRLALYAARAKAHTRCRTEGCAARSGRHDRAEPIGVADPALEGEATSASLNGVAGSSGSAGASGVYGENTARGYGTYGRSNVGAGFGAVGESTSGTGVQGTTTTGIGV
jgi:hypothetical protein